MNFLQKFDVAQVTSD